MSLRIELGDEIDGTREVSVGGEVDMESSPELRAAINKALAGSKGLRVKLADVEYLDSSGIAVLVEGYKTSLATGAHFTLVDPSEQVTEVIKLSQLDKLFKIERSESK